MPGAIDKTVTQTVVGYQQYSNQLNHSHQKIPILDQIEQYRRAGSTRRIKMSGEARPTDYFSIEGKWNKPAAARYRSRPDYPSFHPRINAHAGEF
jgi:hypothetical protein